MNKKNLYIDMEIIPGEKKNTLVSFSIIDDKERTFYAEFIIDYDKLSELDKKYFDLELLDTLKLSKYKSNITIYEIKGDLYSNTSDIETIKVKGDVYYIRNMLMEWLKEYEEFDIQYISKLGYYDLQTWTKFISDDQSTLNYNNRSIMDLTKKFHQDPNGISLTGYKPSFGIVTLYSFEDDGYDKNIREETNIHYKNNLPRNNALTIVKLLRKEYLNSQK